MKYYVVLQGHRPGIYTSREDCKYQVEKYTGAIYKSFLDKESAAFARQEQSFWHKWKSSREYLRSLMGEEFEYAICTDAACPSNPGPVEYRGVRVATGEEIFSYGPYAWWSVNIAEFLAIVEGMKKCKDWTLQSKSWKIIIYSDSKIAISRIQKGKINTTIPPDSINTLLFIKVYAAEQRLHANPIWSQDVILKQWPTAQRGQIPADFGRK